MRTRFLKKLLPLFAFISVLAAFRGGYAQLDVMEVPRPVHIEVIPTVDRYPAGGSYSILFHVKVDEPWHVNSDKPLEEFLIPTALSLDLPEGLSAGRLAFPEAHMRAFDFSDNELSVFEQEFYVLGSIAVSASVDPGKLLTGGVIKYQACNDVLCLPPQTEPFEILLEVAPEGEGFTPMNTDILAGVETSLSGSSEGEGAFGGGFGTRGLLITFLLVYLGGLALNLTPCVYPLIPITVGYFGGQSQGRKGRLLIHAILYVLGMSVTYSVLGVFASLTGSMLGQALQNPVVLIFIALVMILLALSMFGVYEIRVPQFIAKGAGQAKQGYLGTAFMGLTVGIIAAPCIGPFVLGLMTYVGEKGDPVLGFLMFFVLAIGLGTPFLFLALFSGGINKLPSSGDWMVWIRKLFGVILLGMAVYFLSPLMSSGLLTSVVLLLAIASGLYLGFLEGSGRGRPLFLWLKRLAGVAIVLVGIYFVVPSGEAKEELPWVSFDQGILEEQKDLRMPVMIDFTADWCIPCKELDHYTFSDPRVVALSKGIVVVKADLTSFDSPESVALRDQFTIKGVPTVVFLDRNGLERRDLRFVGFIDADALLEKLGQLGLEVVGGSSSVE